MGKVLHKKDDGASTDKNFNIVLPKVQTEGATLNVVLDNKDFMKDITLPGGFRYLNLVWGLVWGVRCCWLPFSCSVTDLFTSSAADVV